MIDRGYVFIRVYNGGRQVQRCAGPVNHPGVFDDAVCLLNRYREKLHLGKAIQVIKEKHLSFKDACELYWIQFACKKKSAKSYAYHLAVLKEFFGNKTMDAITPQDVVEFREWRIKAVSRGTMNTEHVCLITLYSFLYRSVKTGVLDPIALPEQNPAWLIRRDDRRIFARRRSLSEEEFQKMMALADPQMRRIILGAIHTMLRRKDLLALTKDNIDRISNELVGVQAKTGIPYHVPINDVVEKLIETAPGPLLFDRQNFEDRFNRLMERAEIKGFQFRDLRRTGARALLKKGVDLATVSALLGHTNIFTTQSYVGAPNEDKRPGGEILERNFEFDLSQAPPPGPFGRGYRYHHFWLNQMKVISPDKKDGMDMTCQSKLPKNQTQSSVDIIPVPIRAV
jgi:integrase